MNNDGKHLKLVIMIPAYNEEEKIGNVIRDIPKNIEGIKEIEIIVINDGSTDNTYKVANENGTHIISHSHNMGLGITFHSGMKKALEIGADIIVNIDADGQFDPNDIPKLIEPIMKNDADFVTATRFLDKNLLPDMPRIKIFGNKLFTYIINKITGQHFTDTQCGFRAFSRETALRLNLFSEFTYTQEVFLDLVNKNMRIKEIPIKVKYYKNRKSKVVKNYFVYGIKALTIIIRAVRDSRPLTFFGIFGLVFLVTGFITGSWLFVRWLTTRIVSPYTSLVNVTAILLILGFLLIILALMADMLSRNRKIQEETLYLMKKQVYNEYKKEY